MQTFYHISYLFTGKPGATLSLSIGRKSGIGHSCKALKNKLLSKINVRLFILCPVGHCHKLT